MDYVPTEFLIDQIIPTKEVHLIGGNSGVGKTTWGFQMIDAWRRGEPVFGYASYPRPFCYVSCDRSQRSVLRTLERLEIDYRTIPYIDGRGFSEYGSDVFNHLTELARKLVPGCHLLFIEGLATLVPQRHNADAYVQVARVLRETSQLIEGKDLTVIGTVHCPKAKPGEEYLDVRHRLHGTVGWGCYSETIILIEHGKPGDLKDQSRKLMLSPRHAKDQVFNFELDEKGRFFEARAQVSEVPIGADMVLESIVASMPEGHEFSSQEFVANASAMKIGRSTVFAWLKEAVEDGILINVRHGLYRKPATSVLPC